MEPKLPAPNFSPERTPSGDSQHRESFPMPSNPETGFERVEKPIEQQAEAAPPASLAQPSTPMPVMAPGIPIPVPELTPLQQASTNPTTANDDDLIEKEWVDKAKQIIAQTRDDPHRREQEVGALQKDYLQKRYGKELGDS